MLFKLEKPNISKIDITNALEALREPAPEMQEMLRWSENPTYRHWDTVKHKAVTLGIKPEVAWLVIKITRNNAAARRITPVKTEGGDHFTWNPISHRDAFFHEIDMGLGGNLLLHGVDLDDKYKQEFITRGVMEEAIASAQLEGANTARQVAKRMLREGRKPATRSERMILNNYKAMLLVEEEYRHTPISLDVILHLHKVLTEGTLDDPNDAGRLRDGEGDDVHVIDAQGVIYHTGLSSEFVKKEMNKLVQYANQSASDSKQFTHPVVKAVILHFWIGYLHPFTDGNGRLARLLFYWSLLKDGYWGFTYLPISKVIKESHSQYGMAYVYSEQDDNDFTYFLDYHVRKIQRALNDFREYVVRKSKEHAQLRQSLANDHDLNDRQIRTLQYLHANPGEYISTYSHGQVNSIAGPTAAKDVKQLVRLGFLSEKRLGRTVRYFPTSNIQSLFKKSSRHS